MTREVQAVPQRLAGGYGFCRTLIGAAPDARPVYNAQALGRYTNEERSFR